MSIQPTEDGRIRRRDLAAEQILKLLQLEQTNRLSPRAESVLGLVYSPLELVATETTTITSGNFTNHPPQILNTELAHTIRQGQTLTIPIEVIDDNGDAIVYSKTGVGTLNGSIYTYSPTSATTPGAKTATITASDGIDSATITFTITVQQGNRAPTLAAIPNTSTLVGVTINVNLSASDPDGDELTYTKTAGPGSVNASTGAYSYTPTAAGTYTITVQVSDGQLAASRTFTITVTAPTVVVSRPVLRRIGNRSVQLDSTLTIPLSASSGTSPYSYSKSGVGTISGSRYSYSPSSTTPVGTKTATITVTDAAGYTDSERITITVSALPPPVTEPTLTLTPDNVRIFNLRGSSNIFQIGWVGAGVDGNRIINAHNLQVVSSRSRLIIVAIGRLQITCVAIIPTTSQDSRASGTYSGAAIFTDNDGNSITKTFTVEWFALSS